MATGYCVKCKEKGVELTNAEVVQTAKGGFMAKGKHEKCGTTVCAMMSKENAEKAVADGAKKSYQSLSTQSLVAKTNTSRRTGILVFTFGQQAAIA